MSLGEKIAMLHGAVGPYVGNVVGNERLGIPPLNLNDGPQGFRSENYPGTSTAFPCVLAVASTWNTNSTYLFGKTLAKEFKAKGANVLLGPGLNVQRIPYDGRNFEYLSGEDPYLGAHLVPSLVRGIQDHGVIANAKHYINNNQETDRFGDSAELTRRVEFEMYYPPFEAAAQADVGSVMCSYNKIGGVHACENEETLRDLKGPNLGFEGWVMSDWGATHSLSLNQGLDQEMPFAIFMNEDRIEPLVKSGNISMTTIDESIMRMLLPMIKVGIISSPPPPSDAYKKNVTTKESIQVARALAAEAMILLKNEDNILPISSKTTLKIAVVGRRANSQPTLMGDGSGHVDAGYIVTPYIGMKTGSPSNVDVNLIDTSDPEEAVHQLTGVDMGIVVVGANSGENMDRASLDVGDEQDELITAVAKTLGKQKVIVVATVPGAILMPWADQVGGILLSFFPGQQGGNAISDVIFGRVNPSARLPLTIPNHDNEQEMSAGQYPGINGVSTYSEGLLVGYRWYTAHGVAPKFAFGHGLSYTKFSYDGLQIKNAGGGCIVSFTVQNTGDFDGMEVPQLYLSYPKGNGEPKLQLKGFTKVFLKAGESTKVFLEITRRDLSVYSEEERGWVKVNGLFKIEVGSSSVDIRLAGNFQSQSFGFSQEL